MKNNKMPINWTEQECHDMAVRIKNNPEDNSLKEVFLNIFPESGEYFNRQLHLTLRLCFNIYSVNHVHYCSFDEFCELILVHIFKCSFADWNPDYSLKTYFLILTRSNGVVGNILLSESRIRSETLSLETLAEKYPDGMPSEGDLYSDHRLRNDEYELQLLVTRLLPIMGITLDELKLLLALEHRNLKKKGVLEDVNNQLGTDYSVESLAKERIRILRKLRPRLTAIRRFFSQNIL